MHGYAGWSSCVFIYSMEETKFWTNNPVSNQQNTFKFLHVRLFNGYTCLDDNKQKEKETLF